MILTSVHTLAYFFLFIKTNPFQLVGWVTLVAWLQIGRRLPSLLPFSLVFLMQNAFFPNEVLLKYFKLLFKKGGGHTLFLKIDCLSCCIIFHVFDSFSFVMSWAHGERWKGCE